MKSWRPTFLLPEARATTRELATLAWPIATAMLGEVALGLSDTKLVGALGPEALAGVGIATTFLYLCYAIVLGGMRGVKVRAAFAIGEGRPADAVRYGQAGALLGALFGVFVWAITRDVSGVLRALKIDPAMIPAARDFIAARSWGAIGTCAGAALINYLQGIEDSRTPMIVGIGGNVLNIGLAYTLIHGLFGLPALGVRGAGYATAMTEMLELVALGAVALNARARSRGTPAIGFRAATREVLSLGVPTGMHFLLESTAFATFMIVLGSFGATEMAAHQVAFNTIRASFLPGIAIGEAASVLVARSLGRRRIDEADRATRSALALGIGFMSACGVIFALFGAVIASAFSADAEVIEIARRLFLVAAVFQTVDASNMVLRCSLRGAKEVRWTMMVATPIVWICIPGCAFVLGRLLGLGAVGGWIGFALESAIATAFFWHRWTRGPWRKAYPKEASQDAEPTLAGSAVAVG